MSAGSDSYSIPGGAKSSPVSTTFPLRPPFQQMLQPGFRVPIEWPRASSKTNGHAASAVDTSTLVELPPSVRRFQEYLRIKSVQPNPDYAAATRWLEGQAKDIGLAFSTHESFPGKTFSILTWQGAHPDLPTLFLNSHIDVVPVDEQYWTVPPFGAYRRENGDIVARGAQDMKIVGIHYLESIRVLKSRGWTPDRTIHVCFTPEEEVGGLQGMMPFVETPLFRSLNIGFALDEGISNPGDEILVYYGERTGCHTLVSVHGNTGHGSQFIADTGPEKLMRVVGKFMAFRKEQEQLLATGKRPDGFPLALGDVTTPNMVMLKAGNAPNIAPGDAEALFDIRVSPHVDYYGFRRMLEGWAAEEPGVHLSFFTKPNPPPLADLSGDMYGKWWGKLSGVAERRGLKLKPQIFPAGSDARYLRAIGIPALGISYLKNHPVLLHDHDEYVNEKLFLEGIEFYVDLIPELAQA